MPTPKGLQVITMLEEHPLTSPELTGDWEKRLTDIEHGERRPREVHRRHRRVHARDGREDRRARQGEAAPGAGRARPVPALRRRDRRDHQGELEGLRLHELEEPRGDGLRLRHLEARRGPHAHARDRAPAARGGRDQGGHLRLSVTCRQTFSRAPRLERRRQGGVRLSRSRANQRGRCRGIARACSTALSGAERIGRPGSPGQPRTIRLQCERSAGKYAV